MSVLLWFQRDLRIRQNPSLERALQQGQSVIAVYILSPHEDAPWPEGAASRWWLHHSLKKLSNDLLALGIRLQYFKQDSVALIPRLVKYYHVDHVYWSNRHEPHRIRCENSLHALLQQQGVQVKRHTDGLLTRPDQFLTAGKQTAYRVFTPFYKKLRSQLKLEGFQSSSSIHSPINQPLSALHEEELTLDELNLSGKQTWQEKLHLHHSPGELQAHNKLDHFIQNSLASYITQRDFPAAQGTSLLSPHLHFGEISPHQVIDALAPVILFADSRQQNAAEAFLRQLIWREYARYLLWHFPCTTDQSMNPKFNIDFWYEDHTILRQWEQGVTGIPIIDAGMHELWETGIMHNRVRMLVASVLTKNMGIAWQHGARWFWDTLVDADLANNSMGWQWVAGCGVDAAPYFRVFNPEIQAKKFDPEKIYQKRWLVGKGSIQPVIDLAESRQLALVRYRHKIQLS